MKTEAFGDYERARPRRPYKRKTPTEYKEGFDKFIDAKFKEKTLYVGMNDTILSEKLKELGVRRVRYYNNRNQEYLTLDEYPTVKQKQYVKERLYKNQMKKQNIEKDKPKPKKNQHDLYGKKLDYGE